MSIAGRWCGINKSSDQVELAVVHYDTGLLRRRFWEWKLWTEKRRQLAGWLTRSHRPRRLRYWFDVWRSECSNSRIVSFNRQRKEFDTRRRILNNWSDRQTAVLQFGARRTQRLRKHYLHHWESVTRRSASGNDSFSAQICRFIANRHKRGMSRCVRRLHAFAVARRAHGRPELVQTKSRGWADARRRRLMHCGWDEWRAALQRRYTRRRVLIAWKRVWALSVERYHHATRKAAIALADSQRRRLARLFRAWRNVSRSTHFWTRTRRVRALIRWYDAFRASRLRRPHDLAVDRNRRRSKQRIFRGWCQFVRHQTASRAERDRQFRSFLELTVRLSRLSIFRVTFSRWMGQTVDRTWIKRTRTVDAVSDVIVNSLIARHRKRRTRHALTVWYTRLQQVRHQRSGPAATRRPAATPAHTASPPKPPPSPYRSVATSEKRFDETSRILFAPSPRAQPAAQPEAVTPLRAGVTASVRIRVTPPPNQSIR